MGSKTKNLEKNEKPAGNGSDGKESGKKKKIITDSRFASLHSDPRFQKVPKRESKVAIDARFKRVFTDKRFGSSSATLDKRGKRKKGKRRERDSLREYYRIERDEDEDEDKDEKKEEREDEVKLGGKMSSLSEEDSEEEEESGEEEEESGEEAEESTTEEEDDEEVVYEDGRPELAEENIPEIEKETRRLAVVNMDWRHVSATDLYVMLSSFLPKDGQILSVAVYPSEFGLQNMKEEEVRGPVGLFDDENGQKDEDDYDEVDEDVINQKLRAYEIRRLKYYYAVVECDSSATADYLYKACDGIEFERSSNKLDLRFIPDTMEFKHPPRDVATEAPANYEGLDFHSRALQMSKVHLSWDEDEPHRVKTLKQNFKADQLAELELKEFLASDESESDDDEDNAADEQGDKRGKKKDKYRALLQSGDDGLDEAEEEDDQDMEVTFNTGLEDLSKRILEKKDKKSETVWEAYLRKRREKKKGRKNKASKYSSDDDDDSSDTDREATEEADDFFVEEPPVKRKKSEKQYQDTEKKAEASQAELELLLADDKGADAGFKGYNMKRKKAKGKKGKEEINEDKIPAADFDDPRFSAVFSSPLFALDPTDPQFKRSAAYARQVAQKQKGDQKHLARSEPAKLPPKDAETCKDECAKSDVSASKKDKHELSSAVRSVKMKIQQVQSSSNHTAKKGKEKQARGAEPSSLIQRVKKKAKALSK